MTRDMFRTLFPDRRIPRRGYGSWVADHQIAARTWLRACLIVDLPCKFVGESENGPESVKLS